MKPPANLHGKTFGRLTVIGKCQVRQPWPGWLCRCECGKTKHVLTSNLRCGRTKSCGCWAKEQHGKTHKTHGRAGTKEYGAWTHIKDRCLNPRCSNFPQYGGKGIAMDDRWRDSFPAFFADMGLAPTPNHSVDRIDNSKGYSKGNCRWATRKEQARNKTTNYMVSAMGETKLLCEWAEDERCAVSQYMLRERLREYQWDPERAITQPPRRWPSQSNLPVKQAPKINA